MDSSARSNLHLLVLLESLLPPATMKFVAIASLAAVATAVPQGDGKKHCTGSCRKGGASTSEKAALLAACDCQCVVCSVGAPRTPLPHTAVVLPFLSQAVWIRLRSSSDPALLH